jgi:hypothetical protein
MFQRNVREVAFQLMKRKKVAGEKIARITSATPEESQRFTRTQNKKHGPTLDDFKLDLASVGLSSPWNKHAAVLFSKYFINQKKYPCHDELMIQEAFKTHMVQLKAQYKKFINGEQAADQGQAIQNARIARRRNVCYR